MKHPTALFSSIAALSLALVLPVCAQTGNSNPTQNDTQSGIQNENGTNAHSRGSRVAMRMVADRAVLDHTLEANKAAPGTQFRATLEKTVQLNNGPQLPKGTMLLGQVAADDMNQGGTSKLALRFTEAVLKDGQRVPIKATIVGVYQPSSETADGNPVSPGDEVPDSWNDGTLAVDQINVMSGVDLHSRLASKNSGVFVSNNKKDVKLQEGSEIALAIGAQRPGQGRGNNGANRAQNSGNNPANQTSNPQ